MSCQSNQDLLPPRLLWRDLLTLIAVADYLDFSEESSTYNCLPSSL